MIEAEINRTERLLGLILYISTHPGRTSRQMAARFGVSQRTIFRDLAALAANGVPLAYSDGGGYELACDVRDLARLPEDWTCRHCGSVNLRHTQPATWETSCGVRMTEVDLTALPAAPVRGRGIVARLDTPSGTFWGYGATESQAVRRAMALHAQQR